MTSCDEDLSQVKWYVISGGNFEGPLPASAVIDGLDDKRFTWADFAWDSTGDPEWCRICDTVPFTGLMPEMPLPNLMGEILQKIQEAEEKQRKSQESQKRISHRVYKKRVHLTEKEKQKWIWFVQFGRGDCYGPLSMKEIVEFAQKGVVNGQVYAWTEGMDSWQKIQDIPEFEDLLKVFSMKMKRRNTNRVPMVATVVLRHGETMVLGSCRDISKDGMQILSSQPGGDVGMDVQLSVNPAAKDLPSLEINARIVRHLDSGLGFGVRFSKITKDQEKIIKTYLGNVHTEEKKA